MRYSGVGCTSLIHAGGTSVIQLSVLHGTRSKDVNTLYDWPLVLVPQIPMNMLGLRAWPPSLNSSNYGA